MTFLATKWPLNSPPPNNIWEKYISPTLLWACNSLSCGTCVEGIVWSLSVHALPCPYKHTSTQYWQTFSSGVLGLHIFLFSFLKQEVFSLWWDEEQSLNAASCPKMRVWSPETRKQFKRVFSHRSSSALSRLFKFPSDQKAMARIPMYPWHMELGKPWDRPLVVRAGHSSLRCPLNTTITVLFEFINWEGDMNLHPSHTKNLPFKWVCELILSSLT